MVETVVGSGKIFSIVAYDVDIGWGVMKTFEKAVRSPGVRIIIENNVWGILLSKEFRYELWRVDYRLPGGKVFDSKDEYLSFLSFWGSMEDAVLKAAELEAQEEVGFRLNTISFLTKQACGATVEWDLYYVVSHSFDQAIGTQLEAWERVLWYDWYDKTSLYSMLEKWSVSEWRSASVLLQYISGHLSV